MKEPIENFLVTAAKAGIQTVERDPASGKIFNSDGVEIPLHPGDCIFDTMGAAQAHIKKPGIHDGMVVDFHSIIGGPVTEAGCIVDGEPRDMCGSRVVRLNGKRGSFDVDALSLPAGL